MQLVSTECKSLHSVEAWMGSNQWSLVYKTNTIPLDHHAYARHISSVVTWSWCGSWMKTVLSVSADADLTRDIELTTVWSCWDTNPTSKYAGNVENMDFQRLGTSDCPGWQNLNTLLSCQAAYSLHFASRVKLRSPGCWHSRCVNATGEAAHQGLIGHRLQSGCIERTVAFTCALSFTDTLDDSSICPRLLPFLGWFGVSWFICRMRPLVCPPLLKSRMSWLIQGGKTGMSWHISLINNLPCPHPASLMIHRWKEHK